MALRCHAWSPQQRTETPTEIAESGIAIGATLIELAPVIIGGLLTAMGGFVGVYVTHRLSQSSAWRKLRAEKLERLALLVCQTMNQPSFFDREHFDGTPTDEMWAISSMYFPELEEQTHRVRVAFLRYMQQTLDMRKEQLDTGAISHNSTGDLPLLYAELVESVSAFLKKASEVMCALNRS